MRDVMAFAYNDSYRTREFVERSRSLPLTLKRALSQGEGREGEALFRNLAEVTSAAVYIFQRERCVYINPGAEALTGYSRSELLATQLGSLFPPANPKANNQTPEASQHGDSTPAHYEL